MRSEELQEMLAAYALGALDEKSAREVEARLKADDSLRAEFEELRETVALLALTAEPVEPSPDFRVSLLDKIKRTPQQTPPVAGNLNNSRVSPPLNESKPLSNVVPFPVTRQQRNFWSYAPTVGAIAASIAVVFLAFSLYNASRRNSSAQAQIAELNQKLSAAERQLNETQTKLAREREEREMLASPAMHDAKMIGTETTPTARAKLVFDPQTGQALLHVEGLPPAPQGKVYQIWWITDPKKPAPGGVFATDASGKGVLHDQIPAEFRRAQIFAVTLEDEGGSPVPTSKPFLISPSL